MEEQEKKAQSILRRELGGIYSGQSFYELLDSNLFSGFYLKSCHEKSIELKSDVLMELQTIETKILIDKKLIDTLTDDPYEANKADWYTGFTSVYVSDAIKALVVNIHLKFYWFLECHQWYL